MANMSFGPFGQGRTKYMTSSKYLCFNITRKSCAPQFALYLINIQQSCSESSPACRDNAPVEGYISFMNYL